MTLSQTAQRTPLADTEALSIAGEWASPPADEEAAGLVSGSWSLQAARRLLANPSALAGLLLLVLILLLALLAPLLARYDPETYHDFLATNQLPSASHWFGTDYLGRDLWSRVLHGSRVSLPVGLGVVAIEFGIGVPLGLIAGYTGKFVDDLLMRLVDVKLALPGLLLPLGVIAILGPSLKSTVVALGMAGIPIYARLARGATLKVREQDYRELRDMRNSWKRRCDSISLGIPLFALREPKDGGMRNARKLGKIP